MRLNLKSSPSQKQWVLNVYACVRNSFDSYEIPNVPLVLFPLIIAKTVEALR